MRYSCAVILLELAALLRHASLEGTPYRERCPRPHLKNGWVKIRSRGRIAKFNCVREFQLLGEKFATCLGGEWDNPTPLCVKTGCEPLDLSNGQMMPTYRGAVVTFFCNPGYRLEGIAKLYCDGKTWNGTAPHCTALSKEPAVWCDFENEDLCGWTQDPHHHFNWTRLNHYTPSGPVGTGPSYDHTLGKGKDGYYLYIETSGPRKQNDTARLYSPVYGTEVVAAQPSCFIFWYHMYGATVGSLAVYIKPDNTELTDDLEAGFFQSGNKGDVWLNGIVNIPPIGVPFQIIIEGVRGPGYVGDTAIDDVRLANGSDCQQPTTVVPLVTTQPTHELSTKDDGKSCRLRCNTGEETTPSTCDCHSSCRASNTCCEDYAVYCAVTTASTRPSRTFPTPPPLPPLEPHPLESSTMRSQTSEDVFKPIPIPPDPTPLILNLPTRTTPTTSVSTTVIIPTANTSTTILRNLTVAPTSTTKVQRPIIPATTSTARNTTLTTTNTTTTTTTTTTTPPTTTRTTTTRPTTKTATRNTTTKATTTIRPTTKTATTTTRPTTKTATTRTTTTKATTTIRPTTKTTTTTTRATTTTVKKPILVLTTKTTVKKPIVTTTPKPRLTTNVSTSRPRITTAMITKSSTWRTNTMRSFLDNDIPGKEWNTVPREPLMQSEQSVPISLIAGVTVLVATVAVVSIVVSIFIRQRRKSRSQQNLAEDSDVRFLTADEILDFTLARPREDDEDSN